MFTTDLNVCVYPFSIVWDDIELNIRNLEEKLSSIHPQTDLLVLPETFATGFPIGKSADYLKETTTIYQNKITEFIITTSKKMNLAICGSMLRYNEGELTNSAFFVEPNGDITFQSKNHLFSMAGENLLFSKGTKRLQVRYRGWSIALGVCYDIRFPVWCRNRENEYDLMIFVANWPKVRINAWNRLLPARAIENEAYVCGCNCKGIDNKSFEYDGASQIFDFKGDIIGSIYDKNFIYARLSKENLTKFRQKFPSWKDADEFRIYR